MQSVFLHFNSDRGTPGDFTVAVHAQASGGGPADAPIATKDPAAALTGANPNNQDTHEFTASGIIRLEPSTTYYLVMSEDGTANDRSHYYDLTAVLSSSEETGSSGWSIGDNGYFKLGNAAFTPYVTVATPLVAVLADIAIPAGAPRNVGVQREAMSTEVTVTWEAPEGGGELDATNPYEVCVIEAMMEFSDDTCTGAAVTDTHTVADDGSFTYTRMGLTAETEYIAAVRGVGPEGNSGWTAPSAAGGEQIATDSGAAIARAITGIANDAIVNRIAQTRAGGGGSFNFAQTTGRILTSQRAGSGVSALLDGSVFALSSASTGGAGLSFWASGDYLDIGGDEGASDWDGDVISLQLGADTRTASGKVFGAALSHSESDIDYADGEQKLTLTALHPYIGWRASNVDADMWASLAYGTGDLERKVGDDTTTNDATLIGGAFGAAVSIGDNARMHAKIETARLTLDNAADEGGDLDVDAHRARFGAEWSHTTRRGEATLRRALTGGARYDGGDGITGVGAEVGANIGYDNGAGTAITARLWTLAAHDADYDEWGAGASVRHAAGADGQGFALRIEPSWGAPQSRADELLNGDDPLTDRAFDSGARMDGEIAYGIAYNKGMMTPYSGFRFTDGVRTYRIGARYKLRPIPLEMDFEAYRKQRVDIENGVLLKASVRW